MANLEVKGKVFSMSALESGVSKSGKEWKRKTVVVEEGGQYPKKVAITLFGDKSDETFLKDQEVTIQCNVESDLAKDNSGRWFTNINAWKIEKGEVTTQTPTHAPEAQSQHAQTKTNTDTDDLPF